MLKVGQTYKIKIEVPRKKNGFAKATILSVKGNHVFVYIKSPKTNKLILPIGTKLWFVPDLVDTKFSGLWKSEISSSLIMKGLPAYECKLSKLVSVKYQRRESRIELENKVQLTGIAWQHFKANIISRNLSFSGMGISIMKKCPHLFANGQELELVLDWEQTPVNLKAEVKSIQYDWLHNHTNLGLAFVNLESAAKESITQMLAQLENKITPADLTISNLRKSSLADWLTPGKENKDFIHTKKTIKNISGDNKIKVE